MSAGLALGAALGRRDILLLTRGPLEPRGFDGTGKPPPLEVKNVAAAAAEHHRTDPADAIVKW